VSEEGQQPAAEQSPAPRPEPESDTGTPPEPASGESAPAPARPAWSYFLTPAAVLLGAAAIIAAVVLTDRGGEPDSADSLAPALESLSATAGSLSSTARSLAEAADALAAGTQASLTAPGTPATLRDAVTGYAALLGLDVGLFDQCLQQAAPYEAISAQLQIGVALGISATPTFFINNKLVAGAQPASVFAEVIAAELAGSPTSIDEYSPAIRQLAERDPPSFVIHAERPDLTGAFIEGNPDAAVVIVEFSDFQCPFCQRWYYDTLPEVRSLVGDDVALAFAHFPLTQIHPNAAGAHVAAECAGAQDRFWEMHDLLFEQQEEWADLPAIG